MSSEVERKGAKGPRSDQMVTACLTSDDSSIKQYGALLQGFSEQVEKRFCDLFDRR